MRKGPAQEDRSERHRCCRESLGAGSRGDPIPTSPVAGPGDPRPHMGARADDLPSLPVNSFPCNRRAFPAAVKLASSRHVGKTCPSPTAKKVLHMPYAPRRLLPGLHGGAARANAMYREDLALRTAATRQNAGLLPCEKGAPPSGARRLSRPQVSRRQPSRPAAQSPGSSTKL